MNLNYKTKYLYFSYYSGFLLLLLVLLTAAAISGSVQKSFAFSAVTLTVVNNNDSGIGSLRQALLDANANSGIDTIIFSINSGVQTIRPLTPLPNITDPVILDGATQPGFAGTPLIVIDGGSTTGSGDVYGLRVTAGSSIVRSIAINNFQNPAPQALRIDTNDGNVIQGCYIGVDPNGNTRRGNYYGIVIASSNNLIGGTNASERNVISGNSFDNIAIVGAGSNNRIQGNYIGTNAAGTASLNGGFYGIEIFSSGTANIVGGTQPGAGNLISGNGQAGVSAGSEATVIQGNLIGTDATGTQRVPNLTSGVSISGTNILVGGTNASARNVISGNNSNGVTISTGNPLTQPRVQGNYIGVDITGRNTLSNSFRGIEANSPAIIGGTEPGAGNVISGNGTTGLTLGGDGFNPASLVQGNLIGTDATGTVALGNSNGLGIDVRSSRNIIGGASPGARNVISGNNTAIDIGSNTSANLTDNIIQGNYIGTDINGTAALPNRGAQAISVLGSNTIIGGAGEGAGNIIAYNSGAGVRIIAASSVRNVIRRNSFFMNGGLAVDLGASGVTVNDQCDADAGANNLQNYPILTAAVSNNAAMNVAGSLNGAANTAFVLDFYASPTFDDTNFGEGKIYIGSTSVTTAGNCNADFNAALPNVIAGNPFITATATDANGNTSEFSRYIRATGANNFDYDGDGKADVSVFRPSAGAWYLNQSTAGFTGIGFGQQGDLITPADFDGDGKTDIAVFRAGTFYRLNSSNGQFVATQFGQSGDIPVAGDFDGDGKAELAVFRPSVGAWYRINSGNGGFVAVQFGQAGDKPQVADFDGDGKTDLAVFRPSVGGWYILRSSDGAFYGTGFGQAGDIATAADFDGDAKADISVFRPSNGTWYRINSSNNQFVAVQFGTSEDTPAAADYDGDGKADLGVFRPSIGGWYLLRSTAGFTGVQFGQNGDIPTPAAFGQ